MIYDTIVIGGGPAGLSAATWLGRHRRAVLVIDAGEQRNRWVEHVHGLLGQDPVTPGELVERGRDGLRQYPTVARRQARVAEVAKSGPDTFVVELADPAAGPRRLQARRLVLATGVADVFPEVEGFFEHYGADVFHCPTCDGFEARDERVAVFGWGEHIAAFALELLDWAEQVRVITDGHRFEGGERRRAALARRGIDVIEDQAVALLGTRGRMEGVLLASGARVMCTMAFFSIAHRPATALARQLGCAIDGDGYVHVDGHQETTVPGVYAAGDVAPGMQLVPVAIGQGAVAGVACALSLHGRPATGRKPPAPRLDDVLGEAS